MFMRLTNIHPFNFCLFFKLVYIKAHDLLYQLQYQISCTLSISTLSISSNLRRIIGNCFKIHLFRSVRYTVLELFAETFYANLQSSVWKRYVGVQLTAHQHGGQKPKKTSRFHFCYKIKAINFSFLIARSIPGVPIPPPPPRAFAGHFFTSPYPRWGICQRRSARGGALSKTTWSGGLL